MVYEFGTIVKSLAGHDKNEVFILIDSDAEYVYIVDGKSRTLEKPKKKNKKHIQLTSIKVLKQYDENGVKLPINNELVKRRIKEYKQSILNHLKY